MTVELTVDPGAPTFTGIVELALAVSQPTSVVWLNAKEQDTHVNCEVVKTVTVARDGGDT